MSKFFKWSVEIEVSEVWVADGFDLNRTVQQEALHHAILSGMLGYARPDELRVKVTDGPVPKDVRAVQS